MNGYTWIQVVVLIAAWSILAFIIYPAVVVRKFKKELEQGELREKVYDYLRDFFNDEEVRNFIMSCLETASEMAKQKIEGWFYNLRGQVARNVAKAEEQAMMEAVGNDPVSLFLVSMLPKKYQSFAPLLLGGLGQFRGGGRKEQNESGGVVKAE